MGECHYQDGNYKAQARARVIEEMLQAYGLEPERFQLIWCSSAEADRFVEAVTQMTEQLRQLGPSPMNRRVPQAAAS
ncbi:MAG: hydrogenase iron-sulfur subunit [Syntrophobacteraceae bacterium]|nr:hydrogenase iron-sulfur subunit [Syntrophobacteraceae bacterium]